MFVVFIFLMNEVKRDFIHNDLQWLEKVLEINQRLKVNYSNLYEKSS